MKLHKIIISIITIVLVISLLVTNVLGSIGTHITDFNRLYFSNIEPLSNAHSLVGKFVLVDDDEFLDYVCLIYNYNQDYYNVMNTIPYSIQEITFQYVAGQNVSNFEVLVPCMITSSLSPVSGVTGWHMFNGVPHDLTNGGFSLSTDSMPFPGTVYVTGVNPPGSGGPYNYIMGALSDQTVLAYQAGQDPSMLSIINSLNSIQSSLSTISSRINSTNSILSTTNINLSSILNAIQTSNASLSSIANYLNRIYGELETISLTLSDYYYSWSYDFLEPFLDFIDLTHLDLQEIVSKLDSCINYLYDISEYADSIDQNVEEILKGMNGEALKNYHVSTGSHGNMNLWQVIKYALSGGMSIVGTFFGMILDSSGLFSGASSGFAILSDVTQANISYNPVRINP